MKILGVYQITYKNGFVQRKNLISHQDYLNIIKPLNVVIGELEASKKTEKESKILKRVISDLFGSEWLKPIGDVWKAKTPNKYGVGVRVINTEHINSMTIDKVEYTVKG